MTVRQGYLYVFGLTWIAGFYASLLLLTLVRPGRTERLVFRSRLLTTFGTLAYAVYLSHNSINALLHMAILGGPPRIRGWASAGVTLLSLITVMSLAAVSWKFLERPLIRRAHSRYQYAAATQPPSIDVPGAGMPAERSAAGAGGG